MVGSVVFLGQIEKVPMEKSEMPTYGPAPVQIREIIPKKVFFWFQTRYLAEYGQPNTNNKVSAVIPAFRAPCCFFWEAFARESIMDRNDKVCLILGYPYSIKKPTSHPTDNP